MHSEKTNSATAVRPRLMDAEAEFSFDALTRLMVQSLRIPFAIVSRVQGDLDIVLRELVSMADHMIAGKTLPAGREDGVDTDTHRVENPDIRWNRRPSDILMLVP